MTYDQMAERLASDVAESRRFSFYKLTRPYKQADEIVAALRRAAEVQRWAQPADIPTALYSREQLDRFEQEQRIKWHVRRLLAGEGETEED